MTLYYTNSQDNRSFGSGTITDPLRFGLSTRGAKHKEATEKVLELLYGVFGRTAPTLELLDDQRPAAQALVDSAVLFIDASAVAEDKVYDAASEDVVPVFQTLTGEDVVTGFCPVLGCPFFSSTEERPLISGNSKIVPVGDYYGYIQFKVPSLGDGVVYSPADTFFPGGWKIAVNGDGDLTMTVQETVGSRTLTRASAVQENSWVSLHFGVIPQFHYYWMSVNNTFVDPATDIQSLPNSDIGTVNARTIPSLGTSRALSLSPVQPHLDIDIRTMAIFDYSTLADVESAVALLVNEGLGQNWLSLLQTAGLVGLRRSLPITKRRLIGRQVKPILVVNPDILVDATEDLVE